VIYDRKDDICHDETSKGGTGPGTFVKQQTRTAKNEACVLAMNLIEKVCDPANLNRAYKRVKANKGSPGIDGLKLEDLKDFILQHKEQLIESLMSGTYKPQPIRKVMIPKPGGGERQLGIPTVVDRLVQQAILQIIEPIFDKGFSESSFGFRPGRSAHKALKQAKEHVEAGYIWVVDMDLEKFFDRVNHDILMSLITKRVGDKKLLKIIRGFLTAGIMQNGVVMDRHEGTPQGGPLSPLLSNILLDELDKELERRGHKFCRYADDQNIYVRSKRAGERVYRSIKQFLETKLKLKVNGEKSAVALVRERKFLGYRILCEGRLTMAPTSIKRAKDKIRQLTWRSRGRSFGQVITELKSYLKGWISYFRMIETKSELEKLDSWIRRKLRCYKLRQKKRGSTVARLMMSLGVSEKESRQIRKEVQLLLD
jgi:RNA-directed DNA polymerase